MLRKEDVGLAIHYSNRGASASVGAPFLLVGELPAGRMPTITPGFKNPSCCHSCATRVALGTVEGECREYVQ